MKTKFYVKSGTTLKANRWRPIVTLDVDTGPDSAAVVTTGDAVEINLTPAEARTLARRLVRNADRAEVVAKR